MNTSSSDPHIVVVGSINLDFVVGASHIPSPGETILGNSFQTFFGGKGANQAVAAARLGARVTMIGCVGTDPFGAQLIEGLRRAGVDTQFLKRTENSSGAALITIDSRGENSIVVVPGANHDLSPAVLTECDRALTGASIALAQLETPIETVEFLAERLVHHGVPLILDPAPAHALSKALLSRCAWLTPNESEAQFLYSSKTPDGEDFATAKQIHALGASNLILKQGSRGVLVSTAAGQAFRVPAFSVNAIDTTAAGDAFNGAFAVCLALGRSVQESARFANAAAALSVTRAGAQSSMPTAVEVEAFLQARTEGGQGQSLA